MKKAIKLICIAMISVICFVSVLASCDLQDVLNAKTEEGSSSEKSEHTENEKNEATKPEGNAPEKDESSVTGEGIDIDMAAVEELIDSMNASDFGVINGESDYVLIKVKNYGEIVVRLREDIAPDTVKNFKKLVSQGFYNGTIFHRVIENFMIQGGGIVIEDGEYLQKRTDSIYGEFTDNGFENNLLHLRGVISMARTNVPDSATSQFFIMHVDYPYLDYKYASFGYVLAGMDVVDAIATCPTDYYDMPYDIIEIESIAFVMPYEK